MANSGRCGNSLTTFRTLRNNNKLNEKAKRLTITDLLLEHHIFSLSTKHLHHVVERLE